jgi:hypothetical protein
MGLPLESLTCSKNKNGEHPLEGDSPFLFLSIDESQLFYCYSYRHPCTIMKQVQCFGFCIRRDFIDDVLQLFG